LAHKNFIWSVAQKTGQKGHVLQDYGVAEAFYLDAKLIPARKKKKAGIKAGPL
jgi:hypothetical protein